ncbi:hypothetical protein QYF36_022602 [Acer negundo]|nr:hypothetical protein QYF36_022602 [Acer negundo]
MHMRHHHTNHQTVERRWIFPLAIGSLVSLFLLFLTTLTSPDGTPFLPFYRSVYTVSGSSSVFVESKLKPLPVASLLPPPPRFAYLISGSVGDGNMIKRTLLALYHPNNIYAVHLDRESPDSERLDLKKFVTYLPHVCDLNHLKMDQIRKGCE